ncbi:MAG: VCBS repeat-containing protein, partial [Bacteroidota bacterium]
KLLTHRLLSIIAIFLVFPSLLFYCTEDNTSRNSTTKGDDLDWRTTINFTPIINEEYKKQQKLAEVTCSGCHSYVPPEMLDRLTWPSVLSVMRKEMEKNNMIVKDEEWIKLLQFYRNNSPEIFLSVPKAYPPSLQQLFDGIILRDSAQDQNKYTMLKYLASDSTLYCGTLDGQLLSIKNHKLQHEFYIENTPIDIAYSNQSHLVLGIGSLAPTDVKKGQLIQIDSKKNKQIVIDSLHRPIQFQMTKTDQDTAYVIASFGSATTSGDLSLYRYIPPQKTLISPLAGATQSEFVDIDQDEREELVALFSQGNERINIYEQVEHGIFQEKNQITFSPVFGTNSFQLNDFNQDGFLDLVVTNGDNDDYSQILKPYHGVRIYLNDRSNNFKLSYFYQINGASSIKSGDVD